MENKEKNKKGHPPTEEAEVVPVSEVVDDVETELESKDGVSEHTKAVEEARKEALYLKAEFENYKRRILKEQDSAIRFANEKFISELIPVVDLLDRAMASAKPLRAKAEGTPVQNEVSSFVTGIELTQRELVNVLGRSGVEFIGNTGEKFDPSRHEALSLVDTSPDKAGTVLEVLQKGCLLQGRLLSPARVVVGKAK